MTGTEPDILLAAADRVAATLDADHAGVGHSWLGRGADALAGLEQALRRRAAEARAPREAFGGVDLTRPTLARQAGKLRQDLGDLAAQAGALLADVRAAAEAFGPPAPPPADALPRPARGAAVPDFGQLRERGHQLVRAVRTLKDDEASLVIESVTTDLGAGD